MNRSDAFPNFSEYVKAGTEAFVVLKALLPLLPTGGAEAEAKIQAAEDALQKANVELARLWGYQLHDCSFPPQIMLYKQETKDRVCPGCGYRSGVNSARPGGGGGSWMSA